MNLEAFVIALHHENPAYRANAGRSLGMVEEVEVYEVMGVQFRKETDPQVKEVLHWAGQRLVKARQNGITTLDRVFEFFRINAEIDALPDPNEERLLRDMQYRLDSDIQNMREGGLRGKAGLTAAAGLLGGMAGGVTGAAMSAFMANMYLNRVPGDAYAVPGDEHRPGRIPPKTPSQDSIRIWSERLLSQPDAATRITSARELSQINNPAAIPNLAMAFLTDPEDGVRVAAYQAGLEIYLNMRYWNWTQDGTIEREYDERLANLGKKRPESETLIAEDKSINAMRETSSHEIAEILRKAEEARAKRGRRSLK
jgi:hypothetical protein